MSDSGTCFFPRGILDGYSRTRLSAIGTATPEPPLNPAVLLPRTFDQIVVGGDAVPGPMPRETLRRLLDLDLPTHFIYGNGELAMLAQMAGARTGSVTYWGTTSGARPPGNIVEIYRWTTAQLQPEFEPVLAKAAERIRATNYPEAQDFASHNVLQPPSEKEMLEVFAKAELQT